MRFRTLAGLSVSECTIGTAALGRDPVEAKPMLALARDRGVNAVEIDAGDHAAVELLKEHREIHIFARATSRIPFALPSPHIHAQQAYPGHHLRAETEALLRTLGVERLALLQLHAWCPEWLHEGDWLETLGRLRDEGKIAGMGISLFDHDVTAGLEAVASGLIDAVQVMLNVFDQSAIAALPLCEANKVGVIARSPLYFGALAGRTQGFAPDDWRATYFYEDHRRETEGRVARLANPLETALRYPLSYAAVSTVAVGMRSRKQLEANLEAIVRGPLSADEIAALAAHRWLC